MSLKSRREGYTMLDEDEDMKPLTTLDQLPTASGFTCQEIEKTLEENKIVEQHLIWAEYLSGEILTENKNCVNIDILLPNGLLLPTLCPLDGSLIQLKQTIYKYMKKLPLGTAVKDISNYLFFVVSDDGELLELYDEERHLNAVQMFLPVLALKEPKDNEYNKKLTRDIGLLLGNDLEKMEKYALTDELRNFRIELFNNACQRAEQERGTDGTMHYAFFEETILPNVGDRCFSPNSHIEVHEEDIEIMWFPNLPIDAHAQAMQRLKKKVGGSKGLEVWYSEKEGEKYTESVGIKDIFEKTPSEIIKMSLMELDKDHEKPADFILQVAGKRTFITRNVHIIRYEYIRSCFENYRQPILLLRRKHAIFAEFERPSPIFEPFYVRASNFRKNFPAFTPPEPRSFWDLDDNMRVRIKSVSNMEVTNSNVEKVYLKVAVAVGRHILDAKDSTKVSPTNPRWTIDDNLLEFEIYLKDLPESAQLSISLIHVLNGKAGLEEHAVAFINMRLFDWQNRFIQGKHTFYLWPFPFESDELINLLGIQGQNHNTKTVRLELEVFEDAVGKEAEFPDWQMIERYAEFVERNISCKKPVIELNKITHDSAIFGKILRLRKVLDGSKLSEEDQLFLWDARFKIQELFPQMVLVLADCPIIYRERETLCEFYTLLNDWPQLFVDTALELLDVRFPDRYVRAFAVRHLDKCLDNDQLLIYLLPLVQTLKYEPFATSPLADMLLRRALMDYRIGHTFFWLLCSELAMFKPEDIENVEKAPKLYLRLCLMFEAYCRGNSCHMESMIKQKEMVNTLTELSKVVKSYALKDLATKRLRSELSKIKEKMQYMHSPLNPCCRLGELLVEECRVLGSAKMPLQLRWKNPEPMCDLTNPVHEIIFKNGDDLRQDLLTLQVMRIFDAKWKNYNLDYCLTLYEVLPMGQNIGMIHVVQNCHTIFQIQCSAKQFSSNIGIDQKLINRFIYDVCTKDKELNSKMYMESVDRFSYSLAGYCIATYVLGIKDRHQDNLMVVEDGRIFHIDFGHILGHSKVKFGVNRERTEFVLTDHFLCVISHGKEDIKNTYMYKNFRDSCLQGFTLLHYHKRFFIALFRMMRCMNLPELRKEEDFDYLYTSLMYDKNRKDEVEAGFLEIFDMVVKNDTFTNVNWFFHTVRHHI